MVLAQSTDDSKKHWDYSRLLQPLLPYFYFIAAELLLTDLEPKEFLKLKTHIQAPVLPWAEVTHCRVMMNCFCW
jgi:hypothetical protein